jgi:segregation and condensation protein B
MEELNDSNPPGAEEEPILEDDDAHNRDEEASGGEQDAPQAPPAAELPDEQLRSIMEVLLLVSDRPLSINKIQEVIEGLSKKRIYEIIEQVRTHFGDNGFPFQVREVSNGYLLSTLPEYSQWVRMFYAPKLKTSKLSQAALETLAVIAYKQPITRAEVEAIRGVNIDSTLRTLLEKRLVEIVGYKDVIGKPATYGTTNDFLLQFGLKALSDLPSIEELREMNTGS